MTWLTKVCINKAMVFPVVIYRYESWTIKNAELQRIDAFELWYWRRLLRVPYSARRSNQLILKEIDHECSLEGLMLKLKLQYFGHLIQRANLLEKTLMLGKIESKRRGLQMMRWLDRIINSMDVNLSKVWAKSEKQWKTEEPGGLQSIGLQRVRHNLSDLAHSMDSKGMERDQSSPS